MKDIVIREIGIDEIDQSQKFLFRMVKDLFNMEEHPIYHRDIVNMQSMYIENEKNILIGAFDGEELIGTIAIKEYVDRFPVLNGRYMEEAVPEIGRFYLDENYRRMGIGTILFNDMVSFAKTVGYSKLYLHTHRYLPGGFDFWIKKGFDIIIEDNDPEKTVHMELEI